jgi:hypothetical protein
MTRRHAEETGRYRSVALLGNVDTTLSSDSAVGTICQCSYKQDIR